ncbi:MAG: SDR family NAD(P)-dependent oxidoreductase [Alphaproteobacteria bacterium]|nr:SDR family NAD(P)-dependent oxidoreductase [Candidatus Parcubacteria bacterium]NCQ67523.1 SDR family NAD(P)-dependent oxidoreductase [Alphaproteobacteria bacterium]
MDLKNKKILVTGADGFIGSHLVEYLLSKNYDVRAFTHYNSFSNHGWIDSLGLETRKNLDIISGDIRDPFNVHTAMQGCQVVLHLAALIAIPYSYTSPDSYVDTNIKGTLNLLQAARSLSVERFVQTSTSEVYGTALYAPINEKHPLQGQSPYSASKIGSDQMAIAYHRSFDMPISIIRPFNTYGPRQSLRAVIPTIIYQILQGKKYIELGNLDTTRDFSFVGDTVKGFVEIARCDQCIGEVTNIGSGFEISIKDTLDLIMKIMGKNIEVKIADERLRPDNSEVYRLIADVQKAKTLFKWDPTFTGRDGVESGLRKTIEWFQDPDNRNHYPDIDGYII